MNVVKKLLHGRFSKKKPVQQQEKVAPRISKRHSSSVATNILQLDSQSLVPEQISPKSKVDANPTKQVRDDSHHNVPPFLPDNLYPTNTHSNNCIKLDTEIVGNYISTPLSKDIQPASNPSYSFNNTMINPASPSFGPASVLTRRRRSIRSLASDFSDSSDLDENQLNRIKSIDSVTFSNQDLSYQPDGESTSPSTSIDDVSLQNEIKQQDNVIDAHSTDQEDVSNPANERTQSKDSTIPDPTTSSTLKRGNTLLTAASRRSGYKLGDGTPLKLPHYRPIHVDSNDSIFSGEDPAHASVFYIPGNPKPIISKQESQKPVLDSSTPGTVPYSKLAAEDPNGPRPQVRFEGFRNLAILVMIVGNMRLVVENYMKYGFRMSFRYDSGISDHDLFSAAALTASIPCHLFISLLIEKMASALVDLKSKQLKREAGSVNSTLTKIIPKPRLKHLWKVFAALHTINIVLCLGITSYTVYFDMWNPAIGTICVIHSLVVCLKTMSYALTNRDLRDAWVLNKRRSLALERRTEKDDNTFDAEYPSVSVPDLYASQPYPRNLTISNLVYFWWAPTLVYQPVYPRSSPIRVFFVIRQTVQLFLCIVLIWVLTNQYAVPILENSLTIHAMSLNSNLSFANSTILMLERLMKLATVSIIIWLIGFFALFQSFLNILAELTRFADRDFYQDWWNSDSLGSYWKLWNKPVSNYFRRHLYIPLLKRGWSQFQSSFCVFFISAVLHEVLVGLPTHSVLGVAFLAMFLQIPLIIVTQPLEKMRGSGTTIGNCIFWLSFFLGQPLGALVYYFAWNIKYNPNVVAIAASSN